jgi:hypothetical protein
LKTILYRQGDAIYCGDTTAIRPWATSPFFGQMQNAADQQPATIQTAGAGNQNQTQNGTKVEKKESRGFLPGFEVTYLLIGQAIMIFLKLQRRKGKRTND